MANPIELAVNATGWAECVVSYLYDEFCEESEDGDDFLEYLADQVGVAAFVIAASNGMPIKCCLEAYDQGISCLFDEAFDIDDAIEAINLAEIPDDDTAHYDEA